MARVGPGRVRVTIVTPAQGSVAGTFGPDAGGVLLCLAAPSPVSLSWEP